MEMHRNQHFRHVASPTKVSPGHAAAIRASDEFDKEGLVLWHLSRHHDALVLEKGAHPVQDVLPALPPNPTQLVKHLKPVLLKDMKLGKVHKGRLLRGTFCTKTVKLGSVVNILEDETGMATMIFMKNMVSANCSMALAQKLFPMGLQVAVRDPYLHEHDDGMIGILVEKPTDLVILSVPDARDEPVEGRAPAPATNSEQPTPDDQTGARKHQLKQENAAKRSIARETPTNSPANNEILQTVVSHEGEEADSPDIQVCKESGPLTITEENKREQKHEGTKRNDGQDETKLSSNQETPSSGPASTETGDGSSQPEGAGITPNHSVQESFQTSNGTVFSHKEEEKPEVSDASKETGALKLERRVQEHKGTELDERPGETKRSHSSSQLDAATLRSLGNGKFAQGRSTQAVHLYSRAISEAQKEKANSEELLLGYSNRAEAYLKLHQFDKARLDAEAALAIHGKHAKSLYRMGRALLGTGEYEQALHYLKATAELAPQDQDLKQSLLECKRMLAARIHKKKKIYSRK